MNKAYNWLLLISLLAAIENSEGCYCDHYPWTAWSSCSRTCNYGTQNRYRQIQVDDYYQKNFCAQICTTQESRACNQQTCPINCRLGDFGPWSECDPCVKKQVSKFRTRSFTQLAQFKGQPCNEPLVESRPCFPTKLCNMEETNCGNKFHCENGRCISQKLKCNEENDCEDNSDERNCPRVRPVCARKHESIPGVSLMGLGYHILAGTHRGEVLHNSFNGGTCRLVKTSDLRKTYRLPANLESVFFQVVNEEDDVVSEYYNDLIPLESHTSHSSSFSGSGKKRSGIPFLFSKKTKVHVTSSSSFKEAIQASKKKESKFIRIHKVIAVSNFTMKESDLQPSKVFLEALNSLPLEYNYPLYSRIFDDFGTHFYSSGSLGGRYDLLYQYSAEELRNSGLTQAASQECIRTETTRRIFGFKKRKVRTSCTSNSSFLQSSEKSISFIKGGRSQFAAALAWERQGAFPEHTIFTDWLESMKDNPSVIDFELTSILELVKNIPCAATKRSNLRRALSEYAVQFDPCQCAPCPNNAKVVLSGTECLCVCRAGTYGDNCEIRAPDYHSVAVDGNWNCWGSWSPCDGSHKRRRSRTCNNPSLQNGGKPCEGEPEEQEACYFSIFVDRGAVCVNDDEATREGDIAVEGPESGCLKPDPPEHGFIRNEKNHYDVGENAEIVCFSGYTLSGYPFFRCQPDQTWLQRPVECQLSACRRPAASDVVSIFPFKNEYNVGETIRLSCAPTFRLTGRSEYTCVSGPSWYPAVMRLLTCEKDDYLHSQSNCKPGEKQVDSQCVCMNPREDCRHYSEDVCVLDATSEQALTKASCPYLAEKCLDQHSFHFLHSGPCRSGTDVSWANERLRISTDSIKRESCGYDTCYDWERCSESHGKCVCLLPNQCPRGGQPISCIQIRTRKITANLCMLGALKCSKTDIVILHEGSCPD
uniref:Complement C6 n=1 Tax=Pseudonaja textilis TaxID=8673 RepID=A0A670YTC4_PSETE